MEIRIVHAVVEPFEYPDPTWKFNPEFPAIQYPPMLTSPGNDLGYADIESNDWDFENKPVEFYKDQPSKAATKWVAEYKAANPSEEPEEEPAPVWPATSTAESTVVSTSLSTAKTK